MTTLQIIMLIAKLIVFGIATTISITEVIRVVNAYANSEDYNVKATLIAILWTLYLALTHIPI